MRLTLHNQSGQSLIQVLASVAIMSILIMAMVAIQTNQDRENAALIEKLAAIDLQKTLTAALSDGSVCKYILNNPAVLTFDSTRVSPSTPQVLTPTLPIYSNIITGPPLVLGPAVAATGTFASPLSNAVLITGIELDITGAPNPLPAPGPGAPFSGNWIVKFDQTRLKRPIHNVAVSTTLTVDTSTPANAKVTNCMGMATPPPPPSTQFYAGDGTTTAASANVFNFSRVTYNTLFPTPPPNSQFQVPSAGTYLITVMSNTCVGGANAYLEAIINVNGARIFGTTNWADSCGSATASIPATLNAGDTVTGMCGENNGDPTGCYLSIMKFP